MMADTPQWQFSIPAKPASYFLLGLGALLLIVGGYTTGRGISSFLVDRMSGPPVIIPLSAQPGPPRTADLTFTLTADNSLAMVPQNDPAQERWADLAGNYYSPAFISSFSYEWTGDKAPEVRVRIEPSGPTLRGRVEARNLKPNFAYQIKLQGDYARDQKSYLAIGGMGRWRLPGKDTNYTDQDFMDYPLDRKADIEAYLSFDYFVTDAAGNAVRDLELNHSLHVLWNGSRQRLRDEIPASDLTAVTVDASNPALYARPKAQPQVQQLWAERERNRYDFPDQPVMLPPHDYQCNLVLTEESFHSSEADGGWWATVYRVPIRFTIEP
jgi:hypothetical protein